MSDQKIERHLASHVHELKRLVKAIETMNLNLVEIGRTLQKMNEKTKDD